MEDGTRQRNYEKRLTVAVEIIGEDRITMMELLRKVKEECGMVIGCRYKTPREYELTMGDDKGKNKLLDGLKIKNGRIMAKEINNMETVVSFMNLPTYIKDEEITGKLKDWGVNAVSKIKRRMWPGTDIADGTRILRVKFTDTVKSLPYSTKFETSVGTEHFRVIHDRQVKVCRLCIQPGHIVRDCPNFKCFKCNKQGHYARECSEGNCGVCKMKTELCVCTTADDENDNDDSAEDLYGEDEGTRTGEEEVRETEWSELGTIESQRTGEKEKSGKEDETNQVMEKEAVAKGGDEGKEKVKKEQRGREPQEEKEHTVMQSEGEEEMMVFDTPLIDLGDEVEIDEETVNTLKRKMKTKGDEEGSAKK